VIPLTARDHLHVPPQGGGVHTDSIDLHFSDLGRQCTARPDSMSDMSALPSFRKPPVGEVVLGLQFEELDGLDLRHVGQLASRFENKYPRFETQVPLDPAIERFDGPRHARPVSIEVTEPPLFPRLWLAAATGEEMVQLQKDRLLHNWRHTPIGAEYPRYPRLREQFAEDWSVVDSFVQEHQLGTILPTQCEVVYVNQIEADGGSVHADPSRYFSFIGPALCRHGQSEFEAVTFSTSGVTRAVTERGSLAGRLFVELTSGLNVSTRKPTYRFALTVRGAPASRDLGGVLEFFDFARERIVRSFVELTTPEMHEHWERLQ
jgi:uncharacterized protein (TIGR04255 family)